MRNVLPAREHLASIPYSDERFKAIFENPAVGIARLALDGTFLEVNQRLCDILGYTDSELLTKTFRDLTPEDALASEAGDRKRILAGERDAFPSERRYRRKDGSLVWVNLALSLARSADGIPDYFISIVEDISARKRAEQDLRDREERLSLASGVAELGIFEWDAVADRAIWENDRMYEIFGHTRRDGSLSKKRLLERYVHPDDRATLNRALAEGMTTGRPFHTGYRIRRKDGAARWLELVGHFVPHDDEGASRMIGVLADDTERRQAEETLRASEEQFRLMADTAPVMIWAAGTDRLCNFFNRPWLDFTGRPIDAELGDGWAEGVHPEDRERCLQTYVASADARTSFKMDYRLRRHDGEYRWIFDQGVPRFSPSGEFLGYIGSCVDITERKAAESEREKLGREQAARAVAEAASASKDEFLAMVSHELRSPLSAIISYVDLLRHGRTDKTALERVITAIERNARAQLQIVEDLLDSARIITGKLRIEPAQIDLVSVLDAAVDTVRPAAAAKGITLFVDYGPGPEPVLGDATRLQQVIWNLLTNSVKFTPEGGWVALKMKRAGADLHIVVSDTGQGIERTFMPFVFQRLSQAHASPRRVTGLGLGLALTKHLVELHGGTITVESEGAGCGATFTVALPRHER